MKYLVPIDLTRNELQNARIQNLATNPSNPVSGQIYFNTETNLLNFYDGTAWVATGDISQTSIDALSDVTITEVADRQFLVYDDDSSAWVNSTVNLGDLNDVDVEGASSGQALVYDGTNWEPATVSFTLDGLLDVSIVTPGTGEVLYFDGEDWVNQALDTDDVAEGNNLYYTDERVENVISNSELSDLSDVDGTLTPSTDQVLAYNGNQWVPATVDLNFLDDVNVSTPGTGEVLYFDGEDWVNQTLDTDDIDEGGDNLFYTDERVENVISQSELSDLADVDAGMASGGDALVFDGENWVADATTYQKVDEKGEADGYAPLGADGKLPNEFLPDLAITQTFVVADIEARDALEVEEGDVAIVTSTGQAFIFSGDGESGQWILLAVPGAAVLSVTGTAPISSTGGQNPTISLDANGVTDAYLADNAVTTAKIAANAVTSTEIAANAVTSTELADNAVTTVNITDGNVTEAKLDSNVVSKINAKTDRFGVTIGDNTATSFTITHNLNTRDVQVYVYETADDRAQVFADVEHTSTSAVTVKFAVAPLDEEYRVVVVG
jgi:hypothetical protein